MATVTHKLSSYSTITVTYTVNSTSPTQSTITISSVKFTNTRSSGLLYKTGIEVTARDTPRLPANFGSQSNPNSNFDVTLVNTSVAKGTKTKTWTVNRSYVRYKMHAAYTSVLDIRSEMSWQEPDTLGPTYLNKDSSTSISIPVKTSYVVTLQANDGSEASSTLTKWHGETLTLSTVLTRAGYRFDGWATTDDAAKADAVSSYSTDAEATFYAIWTPIITGLSVNVHTIRVENGTSTTESDDGTYCYGVITFDVAGAAAGTLSLSVSADNSEVVFDSGSTASITKSAGTQLSGTRAFRAHNCDTDTKVTFTVDASVPNTSVSGEAPVTASQSDVLSVAYFPLDILGDNYVSQGQRPGHGLAIGLPAKKEGFAVGMDIFFQQWAGIIQMFAGSTPPAGWLLCDGSAVSREDYAVLYAAIGDTWGAGDGSTTFNLPDLRGRAPIGAGTGSGLTARTLGDHAIGAETHTLTGPQSGIQAHSVAVADNWYISTYKGTRSTETVGGISGTGWEMSQVASSGGSWSGQHSISVAAKNATQAHNNMQPSAVVNFIIHTGKTS